MSRVEFVSERSLKKGLFKLEITLKYFDEGNTSMRISKINPKGNGKTIQQISDEEIPEKEYRIIESENEEAKLANLRFYDDLGEDGRINIFYKIPKEKLPVDSFLEVGKFIANLQPFSVWGQIRQT